MDKDQISKRNASAKEEYTGEYMWLAALIVGCFIILMLLAIAGIVIWRHYKRLHTVDNTWAGPPPMADGTIHDDININDCILSRQRSISSMSTAPIISNELQAAQQGQHSEISPQSHFEDEKEQETNNFANTNMPTLPYISSETACFQSDAAEGHTSNKQPRDNASPDLTCLPPPPDDFLHFPSHSPFAEPHKEYRERNRQSNTMQFDDNQSNANQASPAGMMDGVHSIYNINDQLFPPPPNSLF